MKKNILILITLFFFNFCFTQNNILVSTEYKKLKSGQIVEENFTFNFNNNSGKLLIKDNDLGITKEYLIEFKETMYDNGGFFNIVYQSDHVNNVVQNRSKSE
ncbi:MAG: hypothetical protein ACK4FS_05420, partial [Flavobacterium sp.]